MSARAALRRYAATHRDVLEASVASAEACGDRNADIPPALFEASGEAYRAIPFWLRRPAAWCTELRVAWDLGYRSRTAAGEDEDMSPEDARRWQAARTLEDAGELMAQWIEGRIASRPGYCGLSDLESPGLLVPLMARLCRTGFVTVQSQDAFDGLGYDGAHWVQRAAVEGFAGHDLAQRIYDTAPLSLLVIDLCDRHVPRWRTSSRYAFPVTFRDREPYTSFGHHVSRRDLRDPAVGFGVLGRPALDALCSAHQVTVIDLEPGRTGLLWEFLAGVCEQKES